MSKVLAYLCLVTLVGANSEMPQFSLGDRVRIVDETDDLHRRVCVVTSSSDSAVDLACFVAGLWQTKSLGPFAVEAFNRIAERSFSSPLVQQDNYTVEQITLLTHAVLGLTNDAEQILANPVIEGKARLLGLIINAQFGFEGLVYVANSNRRYTPFIARAWNYIGRFLA